MEIYYNGPQQKSAITEGNYDVSPGRKLFGEGMNADFENISDDEELNIRFISQDPSKTVNKLAAQANDWREPSMRSEKRYLSAIRSWLLGINNNAQQERARQILREYHPELHALRLAIREKKLQLASLSFDHETSPETLPRLGQELQNLRQVLRGKLKEVENRLKNEVGVNMGSIGYDGFWLVPPRSEKYSAAPGRVTAN